MTHGGNVQELALKAGIERDEILDFSANINPLGLSRKIRSAIFNSLEGITDYPDIKCTKLLDAISFRYSLSKECILPGNGTSELLFAVSRTLSEKYRRAVIPIPSYIDYSEAASKASMDVEYLQLSASNDFTLDLTALQQLIVPGDVIFLGHPNNPTGTPLDKPEILSIAANFPDCFFVIDEAFSDYLPGEDSFLGCKKANLVVLKSLTKFYAIPGLRLGFLTASPCLVKLFRDQLSPWSVNTLAQTAGCTALYDSDYRDESLSLFQQNKDIFRNELSSIQGLSVIPGSANFILVRINTPGKSTADLAKFLLRSGIAIRTCETWPGLGNEFFRIAVKNKNENRKLVNALESFFGKAGLVSHTSNETVPGRCKVLMIQGTSSNAGKSIITTALCRLMMEGGMKVAPYKSQNMSLNSFSTGSGKEIGIAQAVQAQACRLKPDYRMNPVLLKPSSSGGCHVILNGKPFGKVNSVEYDGLKDMIFKEACNSLDSLREENDLVIIEGAGSPGEVNLMNRDIANMAVARYADSPVLIVGDIDRGGVFASFVGTLAVLPPAEQRLVKGFIINRFRGDVSLLGEALEYMKNRTGIPVVGTVPFLPNLHIPEEDSLSLKTAIPGNLASTNSSSGVDIAVINFPCISNFTDFNPFVCESDVNVRLVSSANEFGEPHAVILPGSRATVDDLIFLKKSGLADSIHRISKTGICRIVGICGGFQILGELIEDPSNRESAFKTVEGLGLLGIKTVFHQEKIVGRRTAVHVSSGIELEGFEIHHGVSESHSLPEFITDASTGRSLGFNSENGNIWGTYLHGIFDNDRFRRWFINDLRLSAGLSSNSISPGVVYSIENEIARLAAVVGENIDMNMLERIIST